MAAVDLLFDGHVSINITQNLMPIQIINDGFVDKSREQLPFNNWLWADSRFTVDQLLFDSWLRVSSGKMFFTFTNPVQLCRRNFFQTVSFGTISVPTEGHFFILTLRVTLCLFAVILPFSLWVDTSFDSLEQFLKD